MEKFLQYYFLATSLEEDVALHEINCATSRTGDIAEK